MTYDVVTVSPDITLRGAMELLADRNVSGAPVVAGRRVIGVISLTDLVAFAASMPGVPTERAQTIDLAVADHRIAARTFVFDPKSEVDGRGWP